MVKTTKKTEKFTMVAELCLKFLIEVVTWDETLRKIQFIRVIIIDELKFFILLTNFVHVFIPVKGYLFRTI